MKLAGPAVGTLVLMLLVAVPVGGRPSLQVGSNASYATYNLNATISLGLPVCPPLPSAGAQPMMIVCPMIAMPARGVNLTGTLGWVATGLNSSTVAFNVSRDVTISNGDLMVPSFHETSNFNESINLASRIISLMPFLRTEMDDMIQMSQSGITTGLPTGMNPSSAIGTVESTMIEPRPVYTMWWVNGPLKANDTVPVLMFPTNVTGSTTVNVLGKSLTAWSLVFKLPNILPMSGASTIAPTWIGNGFEAVFTFNYDQNSDLLLSASVNIHSEFEFDTSVASQTCTSSMTTSAAWCNTTNGSVTMISSCGFSIQASLLLSKTNVSLDQRVGSADPSGSGSSDTSGPGTSGTGPSSGGSSPSSGGSSPSSGPGSGTGSGTGSGPGSSQGSSPQPTLNQPKPVSTIPWLYWILGILIAVIVVAGVLAARRRKKSQSQATS